MDNMFYRSVNKTLTQVERGEGIYLYDIEGNKYIDACSGAAVSNIGHGNKRVAQAIANQAEKVAFAHLSRWKSSPGMEMADLVAEMAPGTINKLYPVSGGSEATEAALKMCRQYFLERDGNTGKNAIISRWNGFHGNTIGSLSMTGDGRRKKYNPFLLNFPHIESCYCYRCPFNKEIETCDVECALALERCLNFIGAESITAFIAEPIVGAASGALVPHPEYFKIVREICDRYDILLISDEVMTGFGRAGTMFAISDFGVIPDMITVAKGMSAGYAPLGAVLVKDEIHATFKAGSGVFVHGHTYGGNPLSAAAAVEVLKITKEENLVENSRVVGAYLLEQMKEKILPFWFVGDVRGKGLMQGVELVKDKKTKEPFLAKHGVAEKLTVTLMKHGVIIYPGSGMVDGINGDQFLLAPPLTITKDQVDELIEKMAAGFAAFEKELRNVT